MKPIYDTAYPDRPVSGSTRAPVGSAGVICWPAYACCTSGGILAYSKPIPKPGLHTRPFWEGAKNGKLMLPKCDDCSHVHWYPRHICPHCHSTNLSWVEASGKGTIHTFAVQHMAFGPWAEDAPFVTAYIDLQEGDRMLTVLRGVDP